MPRGLRNGWDQDKIRTALNALYGDQIIDNLIRAAKGLPFVQLDYTNATATVTVTEPGNIGGTQTSEPNSVNLVGSILRLASSKRSGSSSSRSDWTRFVRNDPTQSSSSPQRDRLKPGRAPDHDVRTF